MHTGILQRSISSLVSTSASQYPIVTITGPRQSGKTTLARTLFPDLPYVNFERPDLRERFQDDPRGLLAGLKAGAVFDEVQRVPEIASWLQNGAPAAITLFSGGTRVRGGRRQYRFSFVSRLLSAHPRPGPRLGAGLWRLCANLCRKGCAAILGDQAPGHLSTLPSPLRGSGRSTSQPRIPRRRCRHIRGPGDMFWTNWL